MKLILLHSLLLQFVFIVRPSFAFRKEQDAVIFPHPAKLHSSESKLAASIRIASALSQYETLDDMNNFLNITNTDYGLFVETRFASERSNGELAQPAACKAELQVVKMIEKPETSVLYKPSCTRLRRCSGCCLHENLACEPTETILRNFEVRKLEITNENSIVEVGREIVPLEEHIKCRCLCRTKLEDCTKRQIYVPEECRCACLNLDEERKCSDMSNKLWDPNHCTCMCREFLTCNTGFLFDDNTCRCKLVSTQQSWASNRRGTNYNPPSGRTAETPIIYPLNANDPRRRPKEDPEY